MRINGDVHDRMNIEITIRQDARGAARRARTARIARMCRRSIKSCCRICLRPEAAHAGSCATSTMRKISSLHTDADSRIERAMSLLPHRSRELLRLRELEGPSYRELADAMGIPMGTVMSGLARARDAFRDALQNQAVTQS